MLSRAAPCCPHVPQELDSRLDRVAAADVSLVLWSFAELRLFPPQALLQRVCVAIVPQLGGLPPQDLAITLQVGGFGGALEGLWRGVGGACSCLQLFAVVCSGVHGGTCRRRGLGGACRLHSGWQVQLLAGAVACRCRCLQVQRCTWVVVHVHVAAAGAGQHA